MAPDIVAEFGEEAVNQNDRLVRVIFQNGQLTVIFLDRTGQSISSADRFEQVCRERCIRRDPVGEIVHRTDVDIHRFEFALRTGPGIDKRRVARRGADLKTDSMPPTVP